MGTAKIRLTYAMLKGLLALPNATQIKRVNDTDYHETLDIIIEDPTLPITEPGMALLAIAPVYGAELCADGGYRIYTKALASWMLKEDRPSITEYHLRCKDCGWVGRVDGVIPDIDDEGGLGCPECGRVLDSRAP